MGGTATWRLDLAGSALFTGWMAWLGVATAFGAPVGYWLLVGTGSVVVWWAGRLIGERVRWLVPAGIVAAAALIAGMSGSAGMSGDAISPPFGYANANAAFFLQAGIAGLIVGRTAPRNWHRRFGFVAAGGFAAIALLNRSITALLIVGLVIPVAYLLERFRGVRTAVAFCASFWAIVLGVTVSLGAWYEPGRTGGDDVAGRVLSERRLALWQEAVQMATEHPILGVRPREFQEVSAIARSDRDARYAHHEFLQHGAEVGVPGLILMIGMFAWGFSKVRAGDDVRRSVPGATAWAALGAHACVDYVLHYALLPLTAAALLGSCTPLRAAPQAAEWKQPVQAKEREW